MHVSKSQRQYTYGDGTIVSAVHSFSHHGLGDKKLRQSVPLEMQHCAVNNALNIIRASTSCNDFKVFPGGDFTSLKVIPLYEFSRFAALKRWLSSLFAPIEYSAMSYYTNISQCQFAFDFCIIRNIRALSGTLSYMLLYAMLTYGLFKGRYSRKRCSLRAWA